MMEAEYKQLVRDLIHLREKDGLAIFEVADRVEKVLREAIAKDVESCLCLYELHDGKKPRPRYEGDVGCVSINDEHCEVVQHCADVVRDQW